MKSIFKFNGEVHSIEGVAPISTLFNELIVSVVNKYCKGFILVKPCAPFGKDMTDDEIDTLASMIFNGHISSTMPVQIEVDEITFTGFIEFDKGA